MIPIRDTAPTKTYPVVNSTIIGINVVIFLIQMFQGSGMEKFVYVYGLVPARYSDPRISSYFSWGQQMIPFFSFMFLHGGFLHLLGNMWSLYIFGDNVEDRLGPFLYLIFYLCCGFGSGLAHLMLNLHSNIPTIGASGAIAGVMGAYFLLYPTSKILTLIPIIFIPWFVEIPAFFFLGIWFVLQLFNAAVSSGSIAWWAHVGGFVLGMILLKILLNVTVPGVGEKIRRVTTKKKSYKLQGVRPTSLGEDLNLYGTIIITPYEALAGVQKMVNIPWGFKHRLFKVVIPPGTKEGTRLRLRGVGKLSGEGQRGDLLLNVKVKF